MEHSIIPNAHECAHLPPPTAADYARLDKALDTIFNKGTNEMTEQTQAPEVTTNDLEELAATTNTVATELLRQDGWNILTEMQKALLKGVNSTSLVVLPVSGNLDLVLSKVSDPEGLKKIMSTLNYDISTMIEAVGILGKKHEGKTGSPENDAEYSQLDALSFSYSELHNYLERGIQPLVLRVADILEEAGITELEIK